MSLLVSAPAVEESPAPRDLPRYVPESHVFGKLLSDQLTVHRINIVEPDGTPFLPEIEKLKTRSLLFQWRLHHRRTAFDP
jgi:hypothetical protein